MTHEERERSLQAIGDVIEHWLTWVQRERDAEGLETTADTHVMFGYEGAPPCWPSVGQLKCWLEVFRATPAVAPEGQVTEVLTAAIASGMQRGLKPSQIAKEVATALTTPAPADEDGELRNDMRTTLQLCEQRLALSRITERYPPDTVAGRLAADVLAKYPNRYENADRENDSEPFDIPEIEGLPLGPAERLASKGADDGLREARFAQPCDNHEYIQSDCPDCGKLA